ncbi:hypothetical protein CLERM_147 [Coxiella-like endosymbiont]|nr:hypothetical protein CLERM_809 [Coxiella-like endosymbiont]PMB55019.1 hypothetical protein CLERM_147 [Coxiella-like endosymbiont]
MFYRKSLNIAIQYSDQYNSNPSETDALTKKIKVLAAVDTERTYTSLFTILTGTR